MVKGILPCSSSLVAMTSSSYSPSSSTITGAFRLHPQPHTDTAMQPAAIHDCATVCHVATDPTATPLHSNN